MIGDIVKESFSTEGDKTQSVQTYFEISKLIDMPEDVQLAFEDKEIVELYNNIQAIYAQAYLESLDPLTIATSANLDSDEVDSDEVDSDEEFSPFLSVEDEEIDRKSVSYSIDSAVDSTFSDETASNSNGSLNVGALENIDCLKRLRQLTLFCFYNLIGDVITDVDVEDWEIYNMDINPILDVALVILIGIVDILVSCIFFLSLSPIIIFLPVIFCCNINEKLSPAPVSDIDEKHLYLKNSYEFFDGSANYDKVDTIDTSSSQTNSL